MRELETQLGEAEIGRCHICALTFRTEADLEQHRGAAHGGREPVTGSTSAQGKARRRTDPSVPPAYRA
jgi:hypothetical protein